MPRIRPRSLARPQNPFGGQNYVTAVPQITQLMVLNILLDRELEEQEEELERRHLPLNERREESERERQQPVRSFA